MSGKSKEEIAFEILAKLKGVGIWGENNQEAILDMYSQCLEATSGLRTVDGQTPLALRMAEKAPAPQAAPAPAAPAQAAPAQAAPLQAQAPQARPAAAPPSQAALLQAQQQHAHQQALLRQQQQAAQPTLQAQGQPR